MKTVISISLGSTDQDYEFKTRFLGQFFHVKRIGVGPDRDRALQLIEQWQGKADAIGLGMVGEHYLVGPHRIRNKDTARLENRATGVPVTTGSTLRRILQEWAVRHTQNELGHFFDNARVLFLDGRTDYAVAAILSEYTDNLLFADPLIQLGVPGLLRSRKQLEYYSSLTGKWPLSARIEWLFKPLSATPLRELGLSPTEALLRKTLRDCHVVVGRFDQIERFDPGALDGKTVISPALSPQRIQVLRDRGVAMAVDYLPQLFPHPVTENVLEAMITAALGRSAERLTQDDYLEIIESLGILPRILYPGGYRRINRFAFVIHPLSQQYLTKKQPLDWIARVSPAPVMDLVEKVAAYSSPFLYSRVSGIRSPTGDEAEGWLITVGGTPREIMAHGPEFTYRRLLEAAQLAKHLGAQIMGLGAFTKVVGDAGITVAKRAPLPITTGNSYSASGALWAAHDAVKRLGLVGIGPSGKMQGSAMVVGATGAIGSVCARLLAKAVDDLFLVSPETAKLLALKESIEHETPGARVSVSTQADRDLADMDMIVTATSGAGKRILDVLKVKPGCVITDVARPLDIPASDVAKRPDVLVIESGEIQLPGPVRMKDIGLPPGVAYACLAETIVLALEGRFENFTLGRNIEWEKVREIYKMGLRHGMQLAAISGAKGVYTEEDLDRVAKLARTARSIPEPARTGKQLRQSEQAS